MEEEEDFLASLRVRQPEQPALSPRAQELRAQGTIARANMALASFGDVQPGTEAEMRRLAEQQNIPLAAARAAGVDNLRRTNAMDTVARSPTVRRAFGDENRARIMADDTDQLSALDGVFDAFRTAAAPFVPGVTMLPEVLSFAQSIPRETLQAGRNVSRTQPFAAAAGAIVPGAPLLPYVERAVSGAVLGGARARVQAELGDRIFFDDLTRRSAPTDVRTREEIALLTSEFERTQRAREEFGVAAWVGETVGYTGAQLAIGLLEAPPAVAAGAVGGGLIGGAITRRPEGVVTGGRIGGGLGLAASQSFFNFRQEAGLAFLEYQNMRLADGTRIDRETARGAAFVTGGINAVLETGADLLLTRLAIPGVDRLLNKPAKEVVDELLQTPAGQDALRQVASRAAQAATVEGFTELLQEIVNVATGQTALASAEGVAALPAVGFGLGEALRQESLARAGQAGLEGIIGGAGVTVVTSPATIPLENYFRERDLRAQRQRAQTATGRIDLVERAIETAGRTRLVDRDRGELARFVNEATEESPVSTIYVSLADAAQLAQEQNTTVEDIVRRMGGTAETIAAAEASGFAMEIPIGDFVASVTKTDLASAAVQIIKTNPLLYTRRELEVLATEGQEQAIAVAERLAAAAQNDVELQAGVLDVQAELERAIEPVRAQLAAAIEPVVGEAGAAQQLGRASAIPYAKIAAEGYGVIAQVLGITPREAMARYPLRIGEMQVGPNLGQPIEEGAPVEGGPIVRAVTREIPVLPEFGTPEWIAMVQAAQDKQARGEALTTNERALINMGREDAAELTRILDRIRNGQELTPASQRFLRERGYDPVTGQRVQDETLGPEETLGQEAKSFSEAFSFSDQQVLEWYAENVTAIIGPGENLGNLNAVLKYKAKPEHKRLLARTEFSGSSVSDSLNGFGQSYLNAISFYRGFTERQTAAARAQTKTEQATARSLFRSMFLATRGFILTNPDINQPIVFTGATPAHSRVYQTFLRRAPIANWKAYETTLTGEYLDPDGRVVFTSAKTYFVLAPESLDLSAFTDTVNEKVNEYGRTVRTTQTGYKQLAGPGRPAPGLAGRPDGVVSEPAPAVPEGTETLGQPGQEEQAETPQNAIRKQILNAAQARFDDHVSWNSRLVDVDAALVDAGVMDRDGFMGTIVGLSDEEAETLSSAGQKVDFHYEAPLSALPERYWKSIERDSSGMVLPSDLVVEFNDRFDPFTPIDEQDFFLTWRRVNADGIKERLRQRLVGTERPKTLQEAFGHFLHTVRAAAFQAALDVGGVQYRMPKESQIASEYYMIDGADEFSDADTLKVRFSDHFRQSSLHERSDFNLNTETTDANDVQQALTFILSKPEYAPNGAEVLAALNPPTIPEGAETLGAGPEGAWRGSYDISQEKIRLGPNSDFSTFLHELGHHFLEVNNKIALDLLDRQKRGEMLTTRQQQHLDDMRLLLNEAIKRSGIEPGEALPEGVVFQAQQEGYLGQDPIEAQEWLRAKAKGLDMSLEGRMKRARAGGWDTDKAARLYHGTQAGAFDAFAGPTFFARHKGEAGMYAVDDSDMIYRWSGKKTDEAFDVTALQDGISLSDSDWWTENEWYVVGEAVFRKRTDGSLEMSTTSAVDFNWTAGQFVVRPWNEKMNPRVLEVLPRSGLKLKRLSANEASRLALDARGNVGPGNMDEVAIAAIRAEGFDGIVADSDFGSGEIVIVFDPSNIRSIHAAFDPDFADSPNLLAQSRTTTDIGLASLAERALEQSTRKNGVAQAWVNDLKKAGVSPEMINYILGPDFAKRQGNIGIEEIRALVREGKLQLQRKDFKPKIATSAIEFATNVLESIAYGTDFFDNRPVLFSSFQNALENLISRLEDASADAFDAARYKNYALRGGKDYRESVYTIPKGVGSEFKDPHFPTEKGNLMHSRSQRWSVGRVVEEMQSFAHQAGAKKGYQPVAAKDKPETGTPLSKTWLSALVALEVNRAAKDGERGVWFVGPEIQNGVFLKNPPRGAVQAYGERVPAALEALSQRYGIPLEQRTITVGTIKDDEVLGSLSQQTENKRITVIGFNLTPKARRAILGGGPAVLAQEGQDGAPPAAPKINPVAQRIRNAYLKLRKRDGEYVWLSDIRRELADLPRDQVDEQIKQLFKDNIVDLTLSEDRGALTAEQKNASLRLGVSDMHLLSMDYFASKPFPTAAPPQPPPPPSSSLPPPPPPPPPIGPAAPEGPRPGQDVIEWFNSLSFEQRRPYHEAFARMAETYFATGEAPTPRLKSLFEQFKEFMLKVYGDIQAFFGAPLSDEVRQAMDRFFIARTNVQRAEEGLGFTPAFATRPAFMSQQEWEGYQELTAQATREANGDLSAQLMRDMQWLSGAKSREMRRLQRQHAAERRAIREEVTAEIADKPVNRARRFIARGIGQDGQVIPGPHKLSKTALQAQFPEVDLRALGFGQYGLVAEQGLDPDTVASMLGYQNGEALLNDLLTAPKQADEIKAETDRRMLERYGETTSREALEQAANEAVHSQLRGRAIHAQHMALAKAVGSRALLRENAKAAAKIIVGRQPASKLSPKQAMAAERLAARRLMTALKADDLTAAATASRDQVLAFEITAETFRAQKAYQDALRLFRRVNTGKKENVAKNRNYDLVQAARAILSVYGAGTKIDSPMAYIKDIKKYDPTLFASLEPLIDDAIGAQKPLKDLSVREVEGLRDVIDQLYTLSREEMKLEIANRQIELQDAVDSLTQRLQDIGAPPPAPPSRAATEGEKRARELQGLGNWLRRVESWARAVDGGVGPFTRLIWRPVSQAADAYRNARNDYIERFRNLFRGIEGSLRTGRQIEAPELGYTFIGGKAELLHAILHTGNESNKRKLLLGMGWGTLMPDGETVDDSRWRSFMDRMHRESVITQADYDFAQSVWDLLEEIKPLAQKAHRAVFGRFFSEITAQTVSTPFGDYRGGYVPAIYDPMRSQDAAQRRQQEEAIEANDSQMFPTPASGFTKSRADYAAPMLLDLRLLTTHIDKVLMFSYLAAPVRGVLRILKQKEFSNALAAYDPTAQTDMLLPWLQRSARQIVETPTTGQGGKMIDGTFRYIRRNSGMGLMMANLVNVLQQVTGFSLAAVMVKPHRLASALVRYTLNPMGTTDAVRAASAMMRERGDNQAAALFGEVTAIIDPKDKIKQLHNWFARHAYFMQVGLQNVMDVIVWQGAYSQAIAEGETHAEAVARGDSAVRLTQTSSLPEDIARAEGGNAGLRVFTHMYNYFNMWGNTLSTEYQIAVRDMGLRKGAGRLVFLYIAGFAVPALIGQLIADAMRGQLPEDDEDDGYLDEWLQYFFGVQAKTALAFAPIVGQVGVATMNAFNDKPYDDRIGGAPAISIVESTIRTPNSVYKAIAEEGDKSRAAKDVLNTLTILTGIPFTVLSRPIGYAIDVAEGDVEPTDELDYARGLVTGSASEASKQ